VLEPGGALAVRKSARDRTKAQVQPAKEGVLDSECESAARREFRRRRFKSIPVTAARSGRQFQTHRMRYSGQLLRLPNRERSDRSIGGVVPVDLAA
jgi:hypothetical protein